MLRLLRAMVVVLVVAGCRSAEERAIEQRNRDLATLPQAIGGLVEQLGAEASARGKDAETISLEALVSEAKVPFAAPQQLLGRTTLARYCAVAESSDGLRVTVCEYPSIDQATRGVHEAKQVRGVTAGWRVIARKKSVLELVSRSDAKPASVEAVLKTFERL